MSRALKPSFRSLATVKLVVNVGEHQTETNGIAWFPCDSTAFLFTLKEKSVFIDVLMIIDVSLTSVCRILCLCRCCSDGHDEICE